VRFDRTAVRDFCDARLAVPRGIVDDVSIAVLEHSARGEVYERYGVRAVTVASATCESIAVSDQLRDSVRPLRICVIRRPQLALSLPSALASDCTHSHRRRS
jgi:hypothetical protein